MKARSPRIAKVMRCFRCDAVITRKHEGKLVCQKCVLNETRTRMCLCGHRESRHCRCHHICYAITVSGINGVEKLCPCKSFSPVADSESQKKLNLF